MQFPVRALRIDMIGVLTDDIEGMKAFYTDVLGFEIKLEVAGNYVEFENDGVRFALSTRKVMEETTGDEDYAAPPTGHSFELAFRAASPSDVDKQFSELVKKGAKVIKEPADMPWGQRTAFFADPDGNVHEVFADLT